jgi:TIR domain
VAVQIATGLEAKGISVWIDQSELKVGDSIHGAIDAALRQSRFGVVLLSPKFFEKSWPRRELSALAALADVEGRGRILPIGLFAFRRGAIQAD